MVDEMLPQPHAFPPLPLPLNVPAIPVAPPQTQLQILGHENKKVTECYREKSKTYKEMATDKTPLHIRAAICVQEDAHCAPISFWFLLKQILAAKDWERIHTHGNHLVLAMIASGKFPSASDFCNKRQSDGNDPHNMRLAGKIELAMKNASYILQLIANCGQKSHVLFPWMYIWSTHLKAIIIRI
jgi:hypothetical protein